MAFDVTPTCRYHDIPLLRSVDEEGQRPANYFLPAIKGKNVNFGWGYRFEVWRCPRCSYMELHDADGDTEE